ncbi:hypothetical protein K9M48_04485 [Candidatus Gracilibacteria bacterium]|nr:hypothetical protein [Candidatus Gracilibacteria bacterium]
MYNKKTKNNFSIKEESIISSSIGKLKHFIDNHAKKLQILSLAGGEPAMFPNIIKKFYENFDNKLIRICTNGIMIDKIGLDNYSPKRLYFAISLDGINLEDNIFRFKSQSILDKIFSNIDVILKKGFSLELLTVLNPNNILKYIDLLKYFELKYKTYIESGQLRFVPFELVNYMNLDKFKITKEISDKFSANISSNTDKLIVLQTYKEYFDKLSSFYLGNNVSSCNMYKRGVYFKYLGDSIWTSGSFSVYGCGSRGHLMMGTMDFRDKFDESFILERRKTKSVDKYFKESDRACKRCFDNWHFYGLFLENKLSNIPYILKKTVDLYKS